MIRRSLSFADTMPAGGTARLSVDFTGSPGSLSMAYPLPQKN